MPVVAYSYRFVVVSVRGGVLSDVDVPDDVVPEFDMPD